MNPYNESVKQSMQKFYDSLSEKDKRRYAAIESQKLGHGGISYISTTLGCSRDSIYQGLKEVETLSQEAFCAPNIRKAGAGRKRYDQKHEGIDAAFLDVLQDNIAGDPMNENVRWTNKTWLEISQGLKEKHHINVSEKVIKQLLKKHGFKQRKIQKRMTMKEVANRNEQFERIAELKEGYQTSGNPIISIDTKKKNILATSIAKATSIPIKK